MEDKSNAMLLVATDIAPADEEDFNRWYDREHVEERVRIAGFLSGTRYQSLLGGRKYLGLYRTESLASFTSQAYQTAFTRQTPWSVANLAKMQDPMRRVCAVESVTGIGTGSYLAILVLASRSPGDKLKAEVAALGALLREQNGFVRCSLLTPDEILSSPLPNESRDNRELLPMILLESSSAEASRTLAASTCQTLQHPPGEVQYYGLSWQLTTQELKS